MAKTTKLKRFIRIIIDNTDTAVAVVCLVVCIIISILGFFGVLLSLEQNVFWILSLLPLITFMVFSKLRRIEKNMLDKSKYFDDPEDVLNELMKMCRRADLYIYATGSRTKKPLLDCIEEAVSKSGVIYKRFIPSKTYITDDLQTHIGKMKKANSNIFRYQEMPNCPNFWVTERHVMIILPSTEHGHFRGVLVTDTAAVMQYMNYFLEELFGAEGAEKV